MELGLKAGRKQFFLKESAGKTNNGLRLQAGQVIEVSDSDYSMIKCVSYQNENKTIRVAQMYLTENKIEFLEIKKKKILK